MYVDSTTGLGIVAAAEGHYDEAARWCEAAIEHAPTRIGAFEELADLYELDAAEVVRLARSVGLPAVAFVELARPLVALEDP